MTALAHEVPPAAPEEEPEPGPGLDEVLWDVWKAMELPEGYRAEIIEESIEVSPTGRRRHAVVINRLRRALEAHLADGDHAAYQDGNVIHGRTVLLPDLFVAPADLDEIPDQDDLGVDAAGVALVVEVTSPGQRNLDRDRVRKRRAYAQAGVPVYVIVDDFDDEGTVAVLSAPNPGRGRYAEEHRVPYGTDAVVPEGPAKGLVIGDDITRR